MHISEVDFELLIDYVNERQYDSPDFDTFFFYVKTGLGLPYDSNHFILNVIIMMCELDESFKSRFEDTAKLRLEHQ